MPAPNRRRGVAIAALAAVVLAAAGSVAAAAPRVGIPSFNGSGEAQIRAQVAKLAKQNGFQVVGSRQIEGTATSLGVLLDSDEGFAAVAKELNIAVFVTGDVGKRRAVLVVRAGGDGAVTGKASFGGANPKKIQAAVAAGFWRELGDAVKQGRPPAGAKTRAAVADEPAEPEADARAAEPRRGEADAADDGAGASKPTRAEMEAQASDGGVTKRSRARTKPEVAGDGASSDDDDLESLPVALELGVGARAMFRQLSWHQDVQRRLAPYSLSPGPEAGFWLEAYPVSFSSEGGAANIGVFGGFNRGFGVTSATADGSRLTTKFQDFLAGIKLRLPVGSFTPSLSIAYGAQSFSLQSQGGTQALPAVAYKFVRAGLGVRIDVAEALVLDLGAAYLLVTDPGTSPGQIGSSDYFPKAKVYAVDVGASLGYGLIGPLGVRAGVDFRQYGFGFHVAPTDPLIAGGAIDRYITAWLGLQITLDGVGHDSDEDEPAAPSRKNGKSKSQIKVEPSDSEEDDDG
jgi:hypothetical protein